jgi:hypothetical protein
MPIDSARLAETYGNTQNFQNFIFGSNREISIKTPVNNLSTISPLFTSSTQINSFQQGEQNKNIKILNFIPGKRAGNFRENYPQQ